MKDIITVIVPAYNAEPFIERCIKSIREQSYRELEILIIDNGSTDRTGSIADRMAMQDERIKVVHEENPGVSGARNTGIEHAAGTYITFVDADDWLRPDMLEKLYDAATEHSCDVAGCGFIRTDGKADACITGLQEGKTAIRVMSGREFIENRIFSGDSRCWSKLYSRSVIGDTRFQEKLTIGEDMLFLLDIMQKNKAVADLSYQGYYYYSNPDGAMNVGFKPSYMDQITCWQEAEKRIEAMNDGLSAKIHSVILVSIMLTAGKLAFVKRREQEDKRKYVKQCRKAITDMSRKEYRSAYHELPGSYRLRVSLFRYAPYLYLFLWKLLKKIHAI